MASRGFRVGGDGAYTAFLAELRSQPLQTDLASCTTEIDGCMEEMMDSPAGSGKSGPTVTSSEAVYVDILASEYGWSREPSWTCRFSSFGA